MFLGGDLIICDCQDSVTSCDIIRWFCFHEGLYTYDYTDKVSYSEHKLKIDCFNRTFYYTLAFQIDLFHLLEMKYQGQNTSTNILNLVGWSVSFLQLFFILLSGSGENWNKGQQKNWFNVQMSHSGKKLVLNWYLKSSKSILSDSLKPSAK